MAELNAISHAESSATKQFLSVQEDRARLSYGRRAVTLPRRCVFAGTANEEQFLADPTGGRRFWPVSVPSKIDIVAIVNDRDQIFAEALSMFRSGVPWYLKDERIAQDEQEERRIADPWEEQIRNYLSGPPITAVGDLEIAKKRKTEVSITEILTHCLGIPEGRQTRWDATRVGLTMSRLGWARIRVRRDGQRIYLYTKS